MIKLFLKFELGKIGKYFKTTTLAKLITTAMFLFVFLCIGVGIYFFFVSGLRYINTDSMQEIRLPLTLFLYELFLLVLSSIVIFSAMVSTLFNLFRGEYNNWILSSYSFSLFPKFIFIKSLVSSLMPVLVLFLPMVLAFNKVYHLGLISLLFILLSVVLFLMILNALTVIAVLVVGFLYYAISEKSKAILFRFKGLIMLLLLIVATLVGVIWKVVARTDLVELFKGNEITNIVTVSDIGNHFRFLPTHPFAMELINWQNGQLGSALYYFLILFVLASVLVLIWWYISPLFYPLWQKFQEGDLLNDGKVNTSVKPYLFSGSSIMALFKKEALISSRNFKGILWFLFLFFIWILQVGSNLVLHHNVQKYGDGINQKIVMTQVLQYIIAIYFISSFTLRFVFPSFSIEKKTMWILGSAPLNFKKIFFGKYFFYTSFFVVLGVLMSYLQSIIIHTSLLHAFYSMMLFIVTIVFIVTLGLSFGALFPNTKTDDPEQISTSMPGLFFTALALIYGALSDWMLYIALAKGNVIPLLFFMVVTLVLIGIFLVKIPNLIKNRISGSF